MRNQAGAGSGGATRSLVTALDTKAAGGQGLAYVPVSSRGLGARCAVQGKPRASQTVRPVVLLRQTNPPKETYG